jgi:hypothetical protein
MRPILIFFLCAWFTYGNSKPARSVNITFDNRTNFNLIVVDHPNLDHGMWTKAVDAQIYANRSVSWGTESRGAFTGTEGRVRFYIYGKDCTELVDGEIFLHWNNPYAGSNEFSFQTPTGFVIEQIGSGKGNRTTITWILRSNGTPNYAAPFQLPDEPLISLQLKIKTGDRSGAGTDNDVWFSIGPHSWKLDNPDDDFERGQLETYDLYCPPALGLRASDIMYYHLEKKGLNGRHGTSDRPDGEWFPESIEITYNGKPAPKRGISRWLASPNDPTWISLIQECKCIPFEARFVNSIRLAQNDEVPPGRWAAGPVTELFKKGGISGWIDIGGCNLDKPEDVSVSVVGRVYRKPVISGDGFATIDIELSRATVCGKTFELADFERFNRKRYIRIEYKIPQEITLGIDVAVSENGKLIPIRVKIPYDHRVLDPLYEDLARKGLLPKEGCIIEASGNLKWDTDNEGWYEIHPPSIKINDC